MFVDSHIHLTHRLFDGEVPCIASAHESGCIQYKNRDALIADMKAAVKRHTVGGVNGRLISAKVSPRPHSRSGNRRLTAA